jgi:hypothetical protein
VHVEVARFAQRDGPGGVTPLQLAPVHLSASHPPRYGARQEVVAGEPMETAFASADTDYDNGTAVSHQGDG